MMGNNKSVMQLINFTYLNNARLHFTYHKYVRVFVEHHNKGRPTKSINQMGKNSKQTNFMSQWKNFQFSRLVKTYILILNLITLLDFLTFQNNMLI